ncbi:hypothetical protein F4808DRAFT_406616 [Astrocystis sublimbata]|nr:hypothetical protein F4808DRAFT_406616 [Astrocystis sublimbata]
MNERTVVVRNHAEYIYQEAKAAGQRCMSLIKISWEHFSCRGHSDQFTSVVLLVLVAIGASITFVVRRRKSRSYTKRPLTPTAPRLEKAQPRELGKWTPSEFRRPTPAPYPDWSLDETKPLPYRPFRYGPKYNVTMGLRTLKHEDWIELDNHFPRFHADKQRRIKERGPKLCRTAPEAFPAAIELLEELAEYLPARYPSLYKRTAVGLDNLWSGESFDVTNRPLPEDPMQMCARLIQDDLAIMIEKPDGQYYFLAGCIVLPGFWRLADKFGMPLSEIHTSGNVPQYKEKLEKGMMNLFRRLKPEEIVGRNNYFFQVDDDLGWSQSVGSEDSAAGGGHVGWETAEMGRAIDHHYFRSERQTLRRLPKSGGVVFTIRTYFHKITDVAEEDYVPGRLASAVRSWGDDVSRYKGRARWGDVLLEFLDRKHEEQVSRGLDLSREDEVRAYPY